MFFVLILHSSSMFAFRRQSAVMEMVDRVAPEADEALYEKMTDLCGLPPEVIAHSKYAASFIRWLFMVTCFLHILLIRGDLMKSAAIIVPFCDALFKCFWIISWSSCAQRSLLNPLYKKYVWVRHEGDVTLRQKISLSDLVVYCYFVVVAGFIIFHYLNYGSEDLVISRPLVCCFHWCQK